MSKYFSKSEEHDLLHVVEYGTGRRGTTYAFGYSYCVRHEVPTHYQKESERIDRHRSLETGTWITRVTEVSEELLEHAQVPGKIDGTMESVQEQRFATMVGEDKMEYVLLPNQVIEQDRGKRLIAGKSVRFYPHQMDEKVRIALEVELL